MTNRTRLLRMGGTVAVAVLAAAVAALATGEVRLVTTHGVSMLPRFRTGDLAVVVRSGGYHVGEIVAYHSPVIHQLVLHRIVAEHGGRFTFKGDNNDFLDPVKLPASAVAGRFLVRIPRGGVILADLHSRGAVAGVLLAVATFGLLGWRTTAGRGQRRRFLVTSEAGSLTLPGWRPDDDPVVDPGHLADELARSQAHPSWAPVLVPLGLAVLSVLLLADGWSTPPTVPSRQTVPYDQHLTFSYTAPAPVGVTYPTGSVTTGDPIFLALVGDVDVVARYQLTLPAGSRVHSVRGWIGAIAELEGPGGWTGQVATATPVPLTGTTGSVQLPVDVQQISQIGQEFTGETGMPLGATDMVVIPTVHIDGVLAGRPLATSISAPLEFEVDGQELMLGSTIGPDGQPQYSQLDASKQGSVSVSSTVADHVDVLGHLIGVDTARALGLLLLLLSILGTWCGAQWALRRQQMDDATLINTEFRRDLVPISASPTGLGLVAFDVDSVEALRRVAERSDGAILVHEHHGVCSYYVEVGSFLYRFTTRKAVDTGREAELWARVQHDGDATDGVTVDAITKAGPSTPSA